MTGRVLVNTRTFGKFYMWSVLANALRLTGNRSKAIESLVLVGIKQYDQQLYEQLARHMGYNPELVAEMTVKLLRQVLPQLLEQAEKEGGDR